MSGVFPGTRTQLYQRLRLLPAPGAGPDHAPCWAQLLWYDNPPACLLYAQDAANRQLAATPLLHLADPAAGNLNQRLQEGLAALGWQLFTCGACRFWLPSATHSADSLMMGTCTLRALEGDPIVDASGEPALLATQSHLALGCPHWLTAQGDSAASPAIHLLSLRPLPKIAEISESKLKPWPRLRLRLKRLLQTGSTAAPAEISLAERSGVGAGTEPCFACQGRIANLGSLTADSGLGDKETFSVWRCRSCFTLYLSDWVDRWERVDSLETEETIWRVAPVEAVALLAIFAAVRGGDHPARRHERDAQRDTIHAQMAGREPISHIIKQGR